MYDDAGNVAGLLNGLSARLLSVNHKAIYVHGKDTQRKKPAHLELMLNACQVSLP